MTGFRYAAALIVVLALGHGTRAETQIFLIDGDGGYGIDRCLAAGERCGELAANALCRARQYAQAVNYGRVDRSEITGGNGDTASTPQCQGTGCTETVAITCSR